MKRISYSLRWLLILQVVAACAFGIWEWRKWNTPERQQARFNAEWERKLSQLPNKVGSWHAKPSVHEAGQRETLLDDLAVWNKVFKLADDIPVYVSVAIGHPRDIGRQGAPGCYYWTVLAEEHVDLVVAASKLSAEARLSRVSATPQLLNSYSRKSVPVALKGESLWLQARSIGNGWQSSPLSRQTYASDEIACLLVVFADEPADLDAAAAQAETKERVTSLAALLMPEIQQLVYGTP